jgi:hypothetical protein
LQVSAIFYVQRAGPTDRNARSLPPPDPAAATDISVPSAPLSIARMTRSLATHAPRKPLPAWGASCASWLTGEPKTTCGFDESSEPTAATAARARWTEGIWRTSLIRAGRGMLTSPGARTAGAQPIAADFRAVLEAARVASGQDHGDPGTAREADFYG